MKPLLLPFVPALFVAGRSTQRMMLDRSYQERPQLDASLFRGDQEFISEGPCRRSRRAQKKASVVALTQPGGELAEFLRNAE